MTVGCLIDPCPLHWALQTGCVVVIRSNEAWADGRTFSAESIMLVALEPLFAPLTMETLSISCLMSSMLG